MSTSRRARGARTLPPSALLTAIPGLLGFIPERSLVLLAFGAGDPREVRTTMRQDLVLDEDGALVAPMIDVLTDLGEISVRNGVRGVVAVLADDRYPTYSPLYQRICEIVDAELDEAGGVVAGFVVPQFTAGARWRTVFDARRDKRLFIGEQTLDLFARPIAGTGRLGDPHSSPTAVAAAVKHGRRVLDKRSDIATTLTPLDHCTDDHHDDIDTSGADDATLLRTIVAHVTGGGGDADLDCATVTAMADGITRLPVRDAALVLSVTDFRHQAEHLWRQLARRLRGREQASAATMLAHLYYIGGEGAYAGVALDHALAADPDWSFATLLDRALRGGVPPGMLWDTVDECYDIAERLGVVIPRPAVARRAV
ncbi:DUF4192 domain-containing protein [Gordonia sp. NPDC003424]